MKAIYRLCCFINSTRTLVKQFYLFARYFTAEHFVDINYYQDVEYHSSHLQLIFVDRDKKYLYVYLLLKGKRHGPSAIFFNFFIYFNHTVTNISKNPNYSRKKYIIHLTL